MQLCYTLDERWSIEELQRSPPEIVRMGNYVSIGRGG